MAEGEFALIPRHLDAALQRPPVLTRYGSAASDLDLYSLYAEWAAQQRDPRLQEHAQRALAAATQWGHPLYEGMARRALAVAHRQAGAWAGAEAELRQALRLFQALPARWQAARTLVELAALAQARADAALARTHYAEALVEFQALGATPDARQAEAALQALAG